MCRYVCSTFSTRPVANASPDHWSSGIGMPDTPINCRSRSGRRPPGRSSAARRRPRLLSATLADLVPAKPFPSAASAACERSDSLRSSPLSVRSVRNAPPSRVALRLSRPRRLTASRVADGRALSSMSWRSSHQIWPACAEVRPAPPDVQSAGRRPAPALNPGWHAVGLAPEYPASCAGFLSGKGVAAALLRRRLVRRPRRLDCSLHSPHQDSAESPHESPHESPRRC